MANTVAILPIYWSPIYSLTQSDVERQDFARQPTVFGYRDRLSRPVRGLTDLHMRWLQLYDSTSIRRPFDCLSKVDHQSRWPNPLVAVTLAYLFI